MFFILSFEDSLFLCVQVFYQICVYTFFFLWLVFILLTESLRAEVLTFDVIQF